MQAELTVRRARRDDFARVRALLGVPSAASRAERKRFRRLVSTLREDLYLAERENGDGLEGLAVIAYLRGLGPPTAIVRDLHGSPEAMALLQVRPQAASRLREAELTPREVEVLSWLAKGKTNRDIGDILGLSPRTVNKHLEHAYAKLGVETRASAAALMTREGALPDN